MTLTEIDILNKKPGHFFSSRWGGKKGNFNLAIKKVYKELIKKIKTGCRKKLKARFICALSISWTKFKKVHSIGKVEGSISKRKLAKMVLAMIQYLFLLNKKLHLDK